MKYIYTIVLMVVCIQLLAQTDSINITQEFVNDIKNDRISNSDMIGKYFIFNDDISVSDKKDVILLIITPKLDYIRNKLNGDCSELMIMKHDVNSEMINSFKLKNESFDNVNYIICDSTIIAPILLEGNNILSISTYSKSEGGTRRFILF